ncbi:MAG TPA: hypothetical protein EYP71_05075 [Dehalococcoidia bacterium]|nr:hypothetical protein [Dehalococcoidia bacterium]
MIVYQILKRVLIRASKGSIPILLAATIFIIILGATVVYFTEHRVNDDFQSWGDCLWWILVTISTVGYGDKVPVTLGGRAIAFVGMVAGPILLVSLMGSLGTLFYDEWQKGVKGMAQVTFKGHVLICGWNSTAMDIVAELRQSGVFSKLPITIIDDTIDVNPVKDPGVSFIRGNPSLVKVLEQANIREAKYAIVLAKNQTATADQQTVLAVLAIKDINPRVQTSAELNDVNNEGHLRRAGCDVIVNTNLLTSKLLALSLQNPVANKVISELASYRGSEIYRVPIPEGAQGCRFDDMLATCKKEHDAIIIGVERNGKALVNPAADFELKSGDQLLVISRHAPVFGSGN